MAAGASCAVPYFDDIPGIDKRRYTCYRSGFTVMNSVTRIAGDSRTNVQILSLFTYDLYPAPTGIVTLTAKVASMPLPKQNGSASRHAVPVKYL